jgi:hypothetical protein
MIIALNASVGANLALHLTTTAWGNVAFAAPQGAVAEKARRGQTHRRVQGTQSSALLFFEKGVMNEREARESGLRLKAQVGLWAAIRRPRRKPSRPSGSASEAA